jgi:hypothetical protein
MDVLFYLFYFRLKPFSRSYLFLAVNPKCKFKIVYMPKAKLYLHAVWFFWLEVGITNLPPPPK